MTRNIVSATNRGDTDLFLVVAACTRPPLLSTATEQVCAVEPIEVIGGFGRTLESFDLVGFDQ
jgi:hypothetical protein